jgi:Protein of unknown function (DUF1353)
MTNRNESLSRRIFVVGLFANLATAISAYPTRAASQATRAREKDTWVDELTGRRTVGEPMSLLRFADAVYVVTRPLTWAPNPGQPYKRVEVPVGFVTDFASVPETFWSSVRPDSDYLYAVIVHDYLYWTQDRPREEADEIFSMMMGDLGRDCGNGRRGDTCVLRLSRRALAAGSHQ